MSDSAIEWTNSTWNPVTGCDRVSPGCANCYAMTLAARLKRMGQPRYQRDGGKASGPGFGVTLHADKLEEPLRWRKPRMVFVNSMSDLFHEEIPVDFIRQVFATMALATEHTFQILTKRPERMRAILVDALDGGAEPTFGPWPLPGVPDTLTIRPQAQIGEYRVDFLLTIRAQWDFTAWREASLVIECDGHDFHDRTKQQASSDRKRDRALQAAGYPVFRFTGSDIWGDPCKCAHEALMDVYKRAQQASLDAIEHGPA